MRSPKARKGLVCSGARKGSGAREMVAVWRSDAGGGRSKGGTEEKETASSMLCTAAKDWDPPRCPAGDWTAAAL